MDQAWQPPGSRRTSTRTQVAARRKGLAPRLDGPMVVHMSDVEVVVIGGGAAGLSGALVLSRARRRVLVIDAGRPRNAPAAHMHGFLSRDGTPPSELLRSGRVEVRRYGGGGRSGTVSPLGPEDGSGFGVVLADGQRVSARRLLVTTGLRDELPDIPGLSDRWARDVLHCPYCHGHEVRDRPLGVLGGSAPAVRYAQIVRQWTADLVYSPAPETLSPDDSSGLAARGIRVVEGSVARLIIDDDRLVGVRMQDGVVVPLDAVFVPPTFLPNNDLL